MITQYHRPASLEEALRLAGNADSIVLGGGTIVGPRQTTHDVQVVDLQDVGIAGMTASPRGLAIGAMTRLSDVAESPDTPPVLADLARRELPRSLRNSATVGGTIAMADWESQFLAGLLAFGASVSVATMSGEADHDLVDVLANGLEAGSIITSVTIDPVGTAAAERTARTPGDVPIVAAVARRNASDGVLVALTGVASTPVLVDPSDLLATEPPSDFRGSAEYRRHLAGVLARRAIDRVGGAT